MSAHYQLLTQHGKLNATYNDLLHQSGNKNFDEAHSYVKTKEPELIEELSKLRASILEHLHIRYDELIARYDYLLAESGSKNYDEALLYVKTKEPELITELIFLRPRIVIEENIKKFETLNKYAELLKDKIITKEQFDEVLKQLNK